MSSPSTVLRVGIVDLGSLALRFDVYEIEARMAPRLAWKFRSLPRLGEVREEREEFHRRFIHELEQVKRLSEEQRIDELLVSGTMVFRSLPDEAAGIFREAEKILGAHFRVLSGAEEAALTARGILANEKALPDSLVLVDIGGGSTEVSFCQNARILESRSITRGALQRFSFDASTKSDIRESFFEVFELAQSLTPRLAIGSSGTIRSIEKIFGGSPRSYRRDELSQLFLRLSALPHLDLLQIPGVEAARVDILLPGMFILETLLEALSIDEFRVSHFSLRHGILDEWLEKKRGL